MQRVRRLASVAVVASLAVAGLAACRSEPSVAAYVGDGRISEARVQQVWDEAYDAVQAGAGTPAGTTSPSAAGGTPPAAMPITRSDVVRTLISTDVLERVAQRQNVTLPTDLRLNAYAGSVHVPAGTEFVRLYAEADTLANLLRQRVQNPPEATDADLREVFDALTRDKLVEGTFEQFKSQLVAQNRQAVQAASGLRNQINEVTAPLRIRVNPRYQPMSIAILNYATENQELRPLMIAPVGANNAVAPVSSAG